MYVYIYIHTYVFNKIPIDIYRNIPYRHIYKYIHKYIPIQTSSINMYVYINIHVYAFDKMQLLAASHHNQSANVHLYLLAPSYIFIYI